MGNYTCCKRNEDIQDRNEIFAGAVEEQNNPGIDSFYKRSTKLSENNKKCNIDENNKENINYMNQCQKDSLTNKTKTNPNEPELINPKEKYLSIKDIPFKKEFKEDINEALNLIEQLKSMTNLKDDDYFNAEGWMEKYPLDDPFFNYNYGITKKGQFIIEDADDDIQNCTVYKGEIGQTGLKHGAGILYTPNRIERGTYRDDKFTGWGRIVQINGEFYEGKIIDGIPNGYGLYKNNKGQVYSGQFLDGKRNGNGKFVTNKFEYDGEFNNGKLDGKGTIRFSDGHVYTGEFKNNEINGFGEFRWKNGDYYKGEMAAGKMEGQGRYEYADGQVYVGQYHNGVKEGKGKLSYPGGKSYDGEFKNGLPDGEGIFTNGTESVRVLFEKGEFKKKLDNIIEKKEDRKMTE